MSIVAHKRPTATSAIRRARRDGLATWLESRDGRASLNDTRVALRCFGWKPGEVDRAVEDLVADGRAEVYALGYGATVQLAQVGMVS